jgi:hypothetical protein
MRNWLQFSLIAVAGALSASSAGGQATAGSNSGIWKAAVPQRTMHGEFDNYDPIGVAAGARVKADCSLNWLDPDDGKLYCFSSGTSLEMFLEMPHTHIEQARRAWRTLAAQAP